MTIERDQYAAQQRPIQQPDPYQKGQPPYQTNTGMSGSHGPTGGMPGTGMEHQPGTSSYGTSTTTERYSRATEPHGPTTGGMVGASYGGQNYDTTTATQGGIGMQPGTSGHQQGAANEPLKELEMKMDELHKLIEGIEYCMLVSRRFDGQLVSRAMKTQKHAPDHFNIYFFTNKESHKLEELAHDNHVNLAYLRPHRGEWVSVSGTAKLVDDRDMIHRLYDTNIKDWLGDKGDDIHNGGPTDPRLGLLFVEPTSVMYSVNRSNVSRWMQKAKSKIKGEFYPGQGKQEEKLITPSELHQAHQHEQMGHHHATAR